MVPLNLDAWWDEPAYKAAQGTLSERGAFILGKLRAHDAAKLKDVLGDVYRDDIPAPIDITKFEWETILRFMGASTGRTWALACASYALA